MESHLRPLKKAATVVSHPASRRLSLERCVELMATRYQWANTTRENAHYYMSQGRFASFCEARGITSVSELTNEAVLDFMGDMRDRVGVSRNTLRRYRNYFRRIADFCATTPGFENPHFTAAAVPDAPREPRRRRPDALTPEEEHALVQAVSRHARDSIMIRIMLACGLRVSELCALCVDDVKLQQRPPRLSITKAYTDLTKTGVDRQVVFRQPYGPQLQKDLAHWIDRQRPQSRYPHLFLAERRSAGVPMTTKGVELMLHRASQAAAIRRVHPHLLRRTWATRLADAGAPVTDLMQQAGWTSIEMVNHYYAGTEERALERMAVLRVDS